MYTAIRQFSPNSSPASSPTPVIDSSPASSPGADNFILDLPVPPPFSLGHPFAASAKANKAPPEYEKKPLTPPRSPSPKVPAKKARYAYWQPGSTPWLPASPPHSTVFDITEQLEAAVWDEASTRVVDNAHGTIELEGRNLTHIPQNFISDISNVYILPDSLEYTNSSMNLPFNVTTAPVASMTARVRSFKRSRSAVGRDPKEIQLYLSSNRIAVLPLQLMTLQNLTLLSIRQNHLTFIPPEIVCLRNLRDLNIAGNRIEYLPAEMLEMSLTQLQVFPNPFLEPPSNGGFPSTASRMNLWNKPHLVSNTKRYLPRIVPLVEMALRVLLSPSSMSARQCLLEEYYDLPLDECPSDPTSSFNIKSGKQQFPHPLPSHLRAILSTCVPHSVYSDESPPSSPLSVDDSWSKLTGIGHCRSPRHRGQFKLGVFVRHAEERFTWERSIAGVGVGGFVPVRWRGCQWGCLDFLDGDGGVGNDDGPTLSDICGVDTDQAAGANSSLGNEEMENVVQVVQLSGPDGLDEFDGE